MQNITVKVSYTGKTIIIGKGVKSEEAIIFELQKRFPQIQAIKQSLTIEFDNGAENLQKAYQIAERENLKNIKVKVKSGNSADISSILEQSLSQSLSAQLINTEDQKNIKIEQNETTKNEVDGKEQTQSKELLQQKQNEAPQTIPTAILQTPQGYLENLTKNETVSHNQFQKTTISESEQKLLLQPTEKQQSKQEEPQVKSTNQMSISQRQDNPINYRQNEKEIKRTQVTEHKQIDTTQNLLISSDAKKLMESLRKQFQQNIETLKKEYDVKVKTLKEDFDRKIEVIQIQNEDLTLKLQDLQSKCQCIRLIIRQKGQQEPQFKSNQPHVANQRSQFKHQGMGKSKKCYQEQDDEQPEFMSNQQKNVNQRSCFRQQVEPQQQQSRFMYQNVPQNDPFQRYGSKQAIQYSAEIKQIEKRQQIKVGDSLTPRYLFKNIGKKIWPDRVFVYDLDTKEEICMKSLKPNEEVIAALHTDKAAHPGQKLKRFYQLVYYDSNNHMIQFGRKFGMCVNVIGKQLSQKDMFKKFIEALMQQKKIKGKNIDQVIQRLLEFGIDEKGYLDMDKQILADIIKSI